MFVSKDQYNNDVLVTFREYQGMFNLSISEPFGVNQVLHPSMTRLNKTHARVVMRALQGFLDDPVEAE